MEVAPNPVSDKLNIKAILSQQQAQMMVQINDLNGKLMSLQSMKNLQSGEHLFTINTKNWQSGLYVLTLYNEHFSKSTQILIQH
ncbi:MAG: T9SS type A sorting domain-containing protein [Sphingobacteriales bacterium]|nr:T9SS type A sorting domain-containing protein [Sphingobacteriales bacterium]